MKDDFEKLRDAWRAVDSGMPDMDELKRDIATQRKEKQAQITRWYWGAIGFALVVILYVIYTDELGSIFESISEFMLLLMGGFLLFTSRRSITHQKKEYLLSVQDFLKYARSEKLVREQSELRLNLLAASLLVLSVYVYFMEAMLASDTLLWIGSLSVVAILIIFWAVLLPRFQKLLRQKNHLFISKVETLLSNL